MKRLLILTIDAYIGSMAKNVKNSMSGEETRPIVQGAMAGAFLASLLNPTLLPIVIGGVIGGLVAKTASENEDTPKH